MIIRAAGYDDLPGILEIYNDAVLHTTATADYEPSTLQARTEWYEMRVEKGYPVFAAEENGRVVGWSSLSPYHARVGYRFTAEVSVYIAEEWRGKGLGKQLLAALIEAAKERGLHALIASIDAANQASLRLHAGFGFEQAGLLKELIYKFDRWLDVVYMELRL